MARKDLSVASKVALSAVGTSLLFGAFPLLVAGYRRISFRDGLSLRGAPVLCWLGAILFGVSSWPFVHELIVTAHETGLTPLNVGHFEQVGKYIAEWRAVPLVLILVSLAVAPAVFEELFFRGFMLSALRRRMNDAMAIFVAAKARAVLELVPLATSGLAEHRCRTSEK